AGSRHPLRSLGQENLPDTDLHDVPHYLVHFGQMVLDYISCPVPWESSRAEPIAHDKSMQLNAIEPKTRAIGR
ncbi:MULTISPECIES: hypothetical protein, partial [unclassified Variovorax]|uniref:hypothetical protein n=1 Tax=unclassified Variovorax TaxID=663243 RepID=UPI003F44C55A